MFHSIPARADAKSVEYSEAKLIDYQGLIFDLSIKFVNLPLDRTDQTITEALGQIAQFFGADRAYVFDYDFSRYTTSNHYEWCQPGIAPQIDKLQNVPLESVPDWVQTHQAGKPLVIADVQALPEGDLHDILQAQEIKSLISLSFDAR